MIKLSPRLSCAAELVPKNARVIDVGTDHAYLPIYLLESGKVEFAWASDVNPGPLLSAESNSKKHGVLCRLGLYLSDGLKDCEIEKNGYDCVVIFGMGGELIASIIEASPKIKKKGCRFVLQPMTRAAHLREYLSKNGFAILEERAVCDEGKVYQCISCEYTAIPYSLTEAQLACGKYILENSSDVVNRQLILSTLKNLEKIVCGKKKSGLDYAKELSLVEELTTYTEVSNEHT